MLVLDGTKSRYPLLFGGHEKYTLVARKSTEAGGAVLFYIILCLRTHECDSSIALVCNSGENIPRKPTSEC